MEINGINIQLSRAGISLPPAEKGDATRALQSKQSEIADSASSGDKQTPKQLDSLTNVNYVKQQIETIMFSFPPYFPAGTPQRIDLIKGVKSVQDEIESSPLPAEVKEKLAGQKLTDDSTDKEISTALEGVKHYAEGYSPAPSPSPSTKNSQTVNIVSIEI
jgi:hypothetical protein